MWTVDQVTDEKLIESIETGELYDCSDVKLEWLKDKKQCEEFIYDVKNGTVPNIIKNILKNNLRLKWLDERTEFFTELKFDIENGYFDSYFKDHLNDNSEFQLIKKINKFGSYVEDHFIKVMREKLLRNIDLMPKNILLYIWHEINKNKKEVKTNEQQY